MTLVATSADQPVTLRGSGSYNGVPLTLEGKLGNFTTLRDARIPFPMTLQAASGDVPRLPLYGNRPDERRRH